MNRPTTPILSNDPIAGPGIERLPAYSRSLLKIEVPVTVTLATTKQTIGSIIELVPGAILQFEKMCDETLSLEVGGHCVAEGETVKVGDKFGLRLTSMVLPVERFMSVGGQAAQDEADKDTATDTAPPASN